MPTRDGLGYCEPMLAKLVSKLPEGAQWQYEVKWDGYRIQAVKDGHNVCLFSRRGNDFTKRFAVVAKAVTGIKADKAILDGEVVAVDEQGKPSFQMLQNRGGGSPWSCSLQVPTVATRGTRDKDWAHAKSA